MNIINELTPIPYTDRKSINKLRSLLIDIQSAWLDNLFDSGLTFSTPEIAEKMKQAVCLMERRDDASKRGVDLKAIASDYELLEQIFISKKWRYDELGDKLYLDSDNFKGCDLVFMHRFSPSKIIGAALEVVEKIQEERRLKKEAEELAKKEKENLLASNFAVLDYQADMEAKYNKPIEE